MILDLDPAILYKLKLGDSIKTIPTIAFNVETVTHQNVKLNIWVSMHASSWVTPFACVVSSVWMACGCICCVWNCSISP